jgi:hypothetical protein
MKQKIAGAAHPYALDQFNIRQALNNMDAHLFLGNI